MQERTNDQVLMDTTETEIFYQDLYTASAGFAMPTWNTKGDGEALEFSPNEGD